MNIEQYQMRVVGGQRRYILRPIANELYAHVLPVNRVPGVFAAVVGAMICRYKFTRDEPAYAELSRSLDAPLSPDHWRPDLRDRIASQFLTQIDRVTRTMVRHDVYGQLATRAERARLRAQERAARLGAPQPTTPQLRGYGPRRKLSPVGDRATAPHATLNELLAGWGVKPDDLVGGRP